MRPGVFLRSSAFWLAVAYGPVLFLFRSTYLGHPAAEVAREVGASAAFLLGGLYWIFYRKRNR